jgi:hypothetical protein
LLIDYHYIYHIELLLIKKMQMMHKIYIKKQMKNCVKLIKHGQVLFMMLEELESLNQLF